MKIDKSDYYPYMPGSSRNDEDDEEKKEETPEQPAPESASPEPAEAVKAAASEAEEARAAEEIEKKCIGEIEIPDSNLTLVLDRISNVVSWLLVPMLASFYGILLILGTSMLDTIVPLRTKVVLSGIVLGTTSVVPMILVLLMKRLGLVDDIGLNGRKERFYPYIILIVCYLSTGWFFLTKEAPMWVVLFFWGGALAATVNLVINTRWKISAHCAGMAGLVALMLVIARLGHPHGSLTGWVIALILLTGLLGTCRVWLGRHTLGQVLAGYIVGFLSVYLLSFAA